MPSHIERRQLRYTQTQLFDLVADIEKYPEFVPWVRAATVRRREGNQMWVDIEIGTALLRRRFGSKAVLTRPARIDIGSDDPLFEHHRQTWKFQPAADGRTIVEYHVDFQFRSRLLQALIGAGFSDTARAVMGAFRRRAREVYGAAGRRAMSR